jgi:hypothetical protein
MRRSLTKLPRRNQDPDGKPDGSSRAVASYREYKQQAPQQTPSFRVLNPGYSTYHPQQNISPSSEIASQGTSQKDPLIEEPQPKLKKLRPSQDLCSVCQKFNLENGDEIIHDGYKTMREGCYICDWIRSLYGIGWIKVISIPDRGRIKLVPRSPGGPGYDYEVFRRLGTTLHSSTIGLLSLSSRLATTTD